MPSQCIVIGASSGGLEPLREVISRLPSSFEVPVFVVMHIPPNYRSPLPEILDRAGSLPAVHPEDSAPTEPAHIYVAPPDHHMLIDDGRVAVKKGPKENGFRPSIDALFRSAAYTYGPQAIGVVLSGAMNDGTSGLWSIKRLGGTAIVQDPNQAAYPSMPRSALEYIEPDYQGSPAQIGDRLVKLGQSGTGRENPVDEPIDRDVRRMALETQIAAGVGLPEDTVLGLGKLTPFTCPECRGTLTGIAEGTQLRFRCHTGHGYTADALLEGLVAVVGNLLWQATRGTQEISMLLQHLAAHLRENGDDRAGRVYLEKSRELERQVSELSELSLTQQNLSGDKLRHEGRPGEPNNGGKP